MEITMDDDNTKSSRIAEEAVGERLGSAPPDEAKARAEMSPEEAVRQLATPAGSPANTAATTAAAIGERVADAYPDPATREAEKARRAAAQTGPQMSGAANDALVAGRQAAQVVARQFNEQPVVTLVAGFALGYVIALMIHGSR
jgi:hypothetical protein